MKEGEEVLDSGRTDGFLALNGMLNLEPEVGLGMGGGTKKGGKDKEKAKRRSRTWSGFSTSRSSSDRTLSTDGGGDDGRSSPGGENGGRDRHESGNYELRASSTDATLLNILDGNTHGEEAQYLLKVRCLPNRRATDAPTMRHRRTRPTAPGAPLSPPRPLPPPSPPPSLRPSPSATLRHTIRRWWSSAPTVSLRRIVRRSPAPPPTCPVRAGYRPR